MGVTKQLYQLQEVDLEIESNEQSLQRMVSQLGDDQALAKAQNRLTSEQQRLDDLKHRQRSAEWEIDDRVNKIKAAEEQLYSGRIKNPKELTSLQHEADLLKTRRDQLENRALEVMSQVESAEADVAATGSEFKKLEEDWHRQQQRLSSEIEACQSELSSLKQKRQQLSAEIDPKAVDVYEKLKKNKGQAVARVEQGICRGCRISLSFSELQRARSGNLVQCSSCGRILFLP